MTKEKPTKQLIRDSSAPKEVVSSEHPLHQFWDKVRHLWSAETAGLTNQYSNNVITPWLLGMQGEICSFNLRFYLYTTLPHAKCVIVNDHCRFLDAFNTGVPMTAPRQLNLLKYPEQYRHMVNLEALKKSKLSRLVHRAIQDQPVLLLSLMMIQPHFAHDRATDRSPELRELQVNSGPTIRLLRHLQKLPVIALGKKTRKVLKLENIPIKAELSLPESIDEVWSDRLAALVKKVQS